MKAQNQRSYFLRKYTSNQGWNYTKAMEAIASVPFGLSAPKFQSFFSM